MTSNRVAIIQARMSSSRLAGKVLRQLAGRPLLQFMLERVAQSKLIDSFVVATTRDPSDDPLAGFCQELKIACFRGSMHDVLDRFYQAALLFHADVVIRLTADCPLIDPDLIDHTITVFSGNPLPPQPKTPSQLPDVPPSGPFPLDFAADRLPPPWKRTLPIGLDVEVCSMGALQRAWQETSEPYQREHVLPYIYEGITFPEPTPQPAQDWYVEHDLTPNGFRIALLNHFPDYGALRWTVDTSADLEFVQQVVKRFEGQPAFTWLDVLALLEREPELAAINAHVMHKSAFDVDQRSSNP